MFAPTGPAIGAARGGRQREPELLFRLEADPSGRQQDGPFVARPAQPIAQGARAAPSDLAGNGATKLSRQRHAGDDGVGVLVLVGRAAGRVRQSPDGPCATCSARRRSTRRARAVTGRSGVTVSTPNSGTPPTQPAARHATQKPRTAHPRSSSQRGRLGHGRAFPAPRTARGCAWSPAASRHPFVPQPRADRPSDLERARLASRTPAHRRAPAAVPAEPEAVRRERTARVEPHDSTVARATPGIRTQQAARDWPSRRSTGRPMPRTERVRLIVVNGRCATVRRQPRRLHDDVRDRRSRSTGDGGMRIVDRLDVDGIAAASMVSSTTCGLQRRTTLLSTGLCGDVHGGPRWSTPRPRGQVHPCLDPRCRPIPPPVGRARMVS